MSAVRDFIALLKPRITLMVVLTAAAGLYLAPVPVEPRRSLWLLVGTVLVVAGDDHGCVSSSMPHQSDAVFQAWGVPVLAPSSVSDLVEFGLYGYALSRYSGAWVGLAAPSVAAWFHVGLQIVG